MDYTPFDKIEVADKMLAEQITTLMTKIGEQSGNVIFAVSGGSTPFSLYRLLADKIKSFDFDVYVIQVDERFVPSNHNRSNRKQLVPIFDSVCTILPITSSDEDSELQDAVDSTWRRYLDLFVTTGKSGPDITILGMGLDAHTASLFPNDPEYIRSLPNDPEMIGMWVDSQGEERISMNVALINNSKIKILYAHGKSKLKVFQEAMSSGDVMQYPILSVIDDLHFVTVGQSLNWKFADQVELSSIGV